MFIVQQTADNVHGHSQSQPGQQALGNRFSHELNEVRQKLLDSCVVFQSSNCANCSSRIIQVS